MADIKDFCKNAGTEAGVCRGGGFPEERKLQQETAGTKSEEISLKIEKFSYGEKPVLKNIDLTLRPGDFICLCGPNGSGKSTLLNLLEKSANPQTSASREMSEKLASFLPQKEFCAWDTTVLNLIISGRFQKSKGNYTKIDFDAARKAAETLNITKLLDKSVFEISDGEFQKARIARTLCQEKDFLILDEPCANLDFTVEKELLELFGKLSKNEGKGIIISIHNVNAASCFCGHLEFLAPLENRPEGGLFGGSPKDVFTEETISKTFGEGLQIFTHPIYGVPQI